RSRATFCFRNRHQPLSPFSSSFCRSGLCFFTRRAAFVLASGTTLVGEGIPSCCRAADFTALIALNTCFFPFLAIFLIPQVFPRCLARPGDGQVTILHREHDLWSARLHN